MSEMCEAGERGRKAPSTMMTPATSSTQEGEWGLIFRTGIVDYRLGLGVKIHAHSYIHCKTKFRAEIVLLGI